MSKLLRAGLLSAALGLGGYFVADSIYAKESQAVEKKQEGPEISKTVRFGKTYRQTELSELIKYPEHFRNAEFYICHYQKTGKMKTASGGELDFNFQVRIPFDPEQIIGDPEYRLLFPEARNLPDNEKEMYYELKLSEIDNVKEIFKRLNHVNRKYRGFTRKGLREIWDMFAEYESWEKNKPRKRKWKFVEFREFDPKPRNFFPNRWDRYLDKTLGKRLKLEKWERDYLDKLFKDKADLSPRESGQYAQKKLKSLRYVGRKKNFFDPLPISTVFEKGGICTDFVYAHCKTVEHRKKKNKKQIHNHPVPSGFIYLHPNKNKGNVAHSIVTIIHTDPAVISFIETTPGDRKAENMKVLLKNKPR